MNFAWLLLLPLLQSPDYTIQQPGIMPRADSLLTLPNEVKGAANAFIQVAANTNCKHVRWYAVDAGLSLLPPELLKDSRTAVVLAAKEGRFRLLAYTAVDDSPSEPSVCWVVVGASPPGPGPVPPSPPPGPDPIPPTPPIPVPASGLRVLFVYESSANLTREQLNILNSTKIAEYLNAKAAKDAKGLPEWRRWDKDVNTTHESDVWKNLWAATKPQLTQLPAVVIVTNQKGEVHPLPATEAETLDLLKKYGGN